MFLLKKKKINIILYKRYYSSEKNKIISSSESNDSYENFIEKFVKIYLEKIRRFNSNTIES